MTFGDKLQKLRKENHMSQESLAEQIHVSRQAISKWEQGTAMPDTDNIVILSKYFQVPIEYLLFDEYDEPGEVQPKQPEERLAPQDEKIKKTNKRKGLILLIIGVVLEIVGVILAYVMQDIKMAVYRVAYTDAWNYLKEFPLILIVLAGAVLMIIGIVILIRNRYARIQ